MKNEIHPQLNKVIFADTSCGAEFVTTSTLSSKETRDIDGVTHYVINLEISSASHPFYTGKQILVDTARRVEKFEARMKKAETVADNRKAKKAKNAARSKSNQEKQEEVVVKAVKSEETTEDTTKTEK